MADVKNLKGPAVLENQLDELLYKKAPYQVPASGRETLVKLLPWIDLVLVVISLPAFFAIFTVSTVVGTLAAAAGINTGLMYWLSIVFLVLQLGLMAVAIPALFKRQRLGWVLMYYGSLLGIVYALFNWLDTPAAVFALIWSLIVSVLSLYLIFQVRSYYH